MHDTSLMDEDTRTCFWPRVRQFAVPPAMIDTATARREAGDWGGACAAARFDVELDVRAVARAYGSELAGQLRSDLRHLAPDLLRWHLPRTAPDGLLRPGLRATLARYPRDGPAAFHLVAHTAPRHAASDQRIGLSLWHADAPAGRPQPRFRLDLHRHLWDARRAPELTDRTSDLMDSQFADAGWEFEARLLRTADGLPPDTPVAVRLSARRFLLLDPTDGAVGAELRAARGLPVLPYAATWAPPDVWLLRSGALDADRLHPLVAAALVPGHRPARAAPPSPADPLLVDCRGARHRLALVDGRLTALDHPPEQLRREELLLAFGGPPLPCLQTIDRAHRKPDDLDAIMQRLLHGDRSGALTAVRQVIGGEAPLLPGPLADRLAEDDSQRQTAALHRAGLDPGRLRRARTAALVLSEPLPNGRPHRPRPPRGHRWCLRTDCAFAHRH
ncbi:hypothetical protein ACFYS8_36110 [Kitasatospora sp. NPDC004615]|uniref:hypothetical protein n=1 Tax=Kitasatospora sp. NPDC004615 TaxID=3364017 RepID=UPI0036810E10